MHSQEPLLPLILIAAIASRMPFRSGGFPEDHKLNQPQGQYLENQGKREIDEPLYLQRCRSGAAQPQHAWASGQSATACAHCHQVAAASLGQAPFSPLGQMWRTGSACPSPGILDSTG
jgi:hypothetical protein